MLNDFSYSELIIPKIKELINGDNLAYSINSVIVLYDFEYKEALMEIEGIAAEEAEEVARENVFYVASNFTEFLNKLHD
ncbi:hypothetical protein ACEOWJ_000934 [Bacillus cereus]